MNSVTVDLMLKSNIDQEYFFQREKQSGGETNSTIGKKFTVCGIESSNFDCEIMLNSGSTVFLALYGNIKDNEYIIRVKVNSALAYFTDLNSQPIEYSLVCQDVRPREDCMATLRVSVPPSGVKLIKVFVKNAFFDETVFQMKGKKNNRILRKEETNEHKEAEDRSKRLIAN